jgi:hypothetical protein
MTMNKRVELYRLLPEIYRIKDEGLPENYLHDGERIPAYQLRSYLEPVEGMFSAIHENIESLYHDLFIETCDEWVIPYIADLLGTSHLSGDEWTLRADVADTIALRRRKGTLGAIELLAFILTKWGVHSIELLENIVWNQHLNHQRPDEGGTPPYSLPTILRGTPIRGGTVTLRDPSALALLNTPFDPFAHVADVQPHEIGQVRYNLPNLAIYLWRLKAYRLNVTKPRRKKVTPDPNPLTTAEHPQAARIVRINVDDIPLNNLSNDYVITGPPDPKNNKPEGRPVALFNTSRYEIFAKKNEDENGLNISAIKPRLSSADQVPGPMPMSRISDYDIAKAYDDSLASPMPQPFEVFSASSFTAPHEYVWVETYNPGFVGIKPNPIKPDDPDVLDISDVGLQLHIPNATFPNQNWLHTSLPRNWKIRGENLCAWERGLNPPLADREIAIDPERGRIAIGFGDLSKAATHALADTQANAIVADLLLTYTYGAVGEVGAHPISYPELPNELNKKLTPAVVYKQVSDLTGPGRLQAVLDSAITAGTYPIVIEIANSFTHTLNIGAMANVITENGLASLLLDGSLVIRAADGQRPIIELKGPLAFRPKNVSGTAAQQKQFDTVMDAMIVRLEGLYFARAKDYPGGVPPADPATLPLIARAAINRVEILNCTLDPGGFRRFNGTRAPLLPGINLKEPYGFTAAADEIAFKQTPEILIQRSICGAVFIDEGYTLCVSDSIIESIPITVGLETFSVALTNATNPATGYAGATTIRNVTVLGRVRVLSIEGAGGIFTGVVEAFDQQLGCLKYCYFADDSMSPPPPNEIKNRLPQHFACVFGNDARLLFTSEYFGDPAYCQLSLECDQRILEQGSGNDQMGAFNFLLEAHKWRNLQIRFREFMPVGIRPLLIPVT